jgi:2-dehydropantoate 2-reductase
LYIPGQTVIETSLVLAPFFHPDEPKPPVVLIQNGIGIETPVQVAYPDLTILSAVAWLGVNAYDNGARVEHGLREKLVVGVYTGDEHAVGSSSSSAGSTPTEEGGKGHLAVEEFVELLRKGGSDAEVSHEIQAARVTSSCSLLKPFHC